MMQLNLRGAAVLVLIAMAGYVSYVGLATLIRTRRTKRATLKLLNRVGQALSHQRVDEAMEACREHVNAHFAKIVLAGLLELKHCRSTAMPEAETTLTVREGMERTATIVAAESKAHLGLVDAIGRTAPFVGVLAGTAIALAGGTLLSLLTIWWSVYLKNRSERIEAELKLWSSEMRQFLVWRGECSVCRTHNRDLHRRGVDYVCAGCCDTCAA